MPNPLPIALTASFALLAAGCSVSQRDLSVPIRDSHGMAALAQTPALDVQNFRGVVHVRVESGVSQPIVQARAINASQHANTPDWVAADLVQDQGRPVLRVLSVPSSGASDAVYLSIVLPGCSGVRVRNAGGEVILTNVSGAIQVENGGPEAPGGRVVVTTAHNLVDHLALETTSGDIALTMGAYSAGDINAQAPRGVTFHSKIAGASRVQHQGWLWSGVLNRGTSPMTLKAGSGKVTIIAGD